jgi:16S rRNA (cytosine967-C5)-methyltransferase
VVRLDAEVRIALRLGLFQMSYLDRVPDHAAVATSVNLVARRAVSAKGFVNAVLRRVQRDGMAPPPDAPEHTRLGVIHSHPDWLVRMWIDELGRDEAIKLMSADNEAAPTCYRALGNRDAAVQAIRKAGITVQPGAHCSTSFVVGGPVRHFDGLAVVQGEASQLVVEMLDPRPGERVLDACAAPGGKTAAIAGRIGVRGSVVACDPSPLAEERVRTSLENAEVTQRVKFFECPIESVTAAAGTFDAVLADAPCSGLGTLRQHPEIRWRRWSDDLVELAARQMSILEAASQRVRQGGRLVYSTCTIARTENEQVVERFLASHPEFVRENAAALPAGITALCDAEGTLRTYPHRDGIDGFFAVRMRRQSTPNGAAPVSSAQP